MDWDRIQNIDEQEKISPISVFEIALDWRKTVANPMTVARDK